MARTAATPYQATGKWKTFSGTAELAPGIRAVDAHGHTPGHTAYLIESKGERRLLIVGDAVHNHAVQFARPEVAIEFDFSDKKQAVMARKKLFAFAAKEKPAVAGIAPALPRHWPRAYRSKGYAWVPVEFVIRLEISRNDGTKKRATRTGRPFCAERSSSPALRARRQRATQPPCRCSPR